ncbi:hypothetical protein [Aliiglaciecola sp. LCG003]|uniref:hypothetical protein n=1 Tax=Aliiglaciecola sp. LCG003 TaxID=3053655 RepID=UPI00257366D8|nr:hypothetical protein [Aliiglaciecola sp. LCG003]WJG09987.1 hypothetical protein QR722_02820 [Aliiglaciecola sp. LCG003]
MNSNSTYTTLLMLALGITVLTACGRKSSTAEQTSQVAAPSQELTEDPRVTQNLYSTLSEQQAQIDAHAAVLKQDFRLLAFTNKTIKLVGIDTTRYDQNTLAEMCGIRYLTGTGDTLKVGQDMSQRQALSRYAKSYNPIVLQGCLAEFAKDSG